MPALHPEERAMLKAIAHGDDPSIAPRDRLEAIKTLKLYGDDEGDGAVAGLELALHYLNLPSEDLAAAVEDLFR